MNNWEILGIEPTNDIEIIKSAYARKSKIYHPETNPVEFQQLHMAYKNTISSLRNPYYTQPEYRVIQERSFNSKRQITLESIPELINPEDSAQSGTDDIFYADLEFIERIDNATKKHNDSILEKYGLNTLNDLLTRQSGVSEWRQFFTSQIFLDNQYNEEYIKNAASCIDKFFKNSIGRDGRCKHPQPLAFIYINIAYGCFFPSVLTPMDSTENVYKTYLLEPYNMAFRNFNSKRITYTKIEKNPVLLSERFAFYVYRNILETLDSPYINKDLLFQWIAWGLAEEHTARISDIYHHAATHGVRISASQTQFTIKVFRSPIVFELLSYLLAKESTPPVYSEVLNDVCETFMNNQWCCDEIRNLYNAIN